MFCKDCGAEIPDDAKHCNKCGAKVESDSSVQKSENVSFFKKNKKMLVGCCIGLIVVFLLVAILSNSSDKDSVDSNLSEKDFKSQCKNVDFNKLNKNADKYKGDKLKVTGKIIQIMDDGDGGEIRLALDDYYSDVVYVTYDGSNDFVEDDYVTVYGYCDGEYTYTSTIGASITLPRIDAMYIDAA